ncbi:hypothetical protein DL93DRAFT_2092387, partial [Clavulina sp. PMI_390]
HGKFGAEPLDSGRGSGGRDVKLRVDGPNDDAISDSREPVYAARAGAAAPEHVLAPPRQQSPPIATLGESPSSSGGGPSPSPTPVVSARSQPTNTVPKHRSSPVSPSTPAETNAGSTRLPAASSTDANEAQRQPAIGYGVGIQNAPSAASSRSHPQPPHQQQLHNRIASAIHRPLQMVRQPSPLRHQSPPDDRDGPGASPLNPSSAHTPSSSHSSTALREGGRMDDHLGVPMAASPPPHDLQLGGSSEEAFTLSGLQHDPSRNFGNGSGSMDLEPWQIFANEQNVDPFKSDLE